MAVAIPAPAVTGRVTPQLRAAGWTSLAVLVAAFATLPLVVMLAKPIAGLVFVRGSEYANDWGRAFALTLLLVAPAAYALFVGTAGELLKSRVPLNVHKNTMRVATIGMVPYIVLTLTAVFWTTGPQHSFLVAAGLTIPLAFVMTVLASTQAWQQS